MSPLQRSVYWRLALVFFFLSFLFFLDVFAAAVVVVSCRRVNGTMAPTAGGGQSRLGESSESGKRDSVCDWTDWLPYGQTLYMVGLLLGSLVGGAISDRYAAAAASVCCSRAVEWTLPAARLWASAFLPFCFSLGTMGGAPLAWLSSTWTQLHLSLALPQLVCLPLYLSLPESPRWLLLRKRTKVLERYECNSPEDKHCLELLLWSDLQKDSEPQKEEPPGGHAPSDIIIHLKHPTVLLRLFIMSYLSAASALTYFGICMNIGSFGVGVYSAQFFSGLSEAPCLLVPLVRLGRRPISMLALFLSGAACFLSLLLSRCNADPVLVMSLALLGKLCILGALFISTLYSIELFPTVVRQRCASLVNLSFRLGCLVNSLVPSTPNGAISLAAMVVYSSGPMVGCGLCLLLPETSGVPLPDSVEDCERQPRPRPPNMAALWRARKLMSRKPETLPSETEDTHTHTHTH
ncbi:si:dkey-190l8.2 isoform X2 [Clinocottus analis]|uniref:si:dkey-190l8.2 isoform X2 n=1 Tax=Clinocottus analis TaxID=304258 RepID=UPI0035C0BDFE